MIGRDHPNRNDVFGIGDNGRTCHCNDRIEVARRKSVRKIAEVVGEKGMDQRKIGSKRCFEEVFRAIHIDLAFPFFNHSADARWRQHATEATAAGPYPLDEGALRRELDLDLTGDHLLLGFGIEPYVASDHTLYQLCADKLADACPGSGGVIGDDSEIALSLADDLIH